MHFSEEEALFYKQATQAFQKAHEHQKPTLFRFLSMREVEMIQRLIPHYQDVHVMIYGGYEQAEYKRVMISAFQIKESDLMIRPLKLVYNKRFISPTHRHILGTLMSFGITRNHIGDIVVNEHIVVFVTQEMQSYIMEQFKTLLGHPVAFEETVFNEGEILDAGTESRVFLMSLRLDAVIAHGFKLSRDNAQNYIEAEKVKLNSKMTQNTSQIVSLYDIISVRGKGRIKIEAIHGQSKKGRTMVDLSMLR